MTIKNFIKFFLGTLAIVFFFGVHPAISASFEPPDGKTLFIIGQDIDNIEQYVENFSPLPAGFAAYTSVEFAEGLTEADDNGGGVQFAQKLADTYPNAVIQLALYMVDMTEKTIQGDVDDSIKKIGAWIKSTNRPVYFRIGYEFDYPGNHYDPDEYKRAYRYIVDQFRKDGVNNVAYVWHSYAAKKERPFLDWYPGDDYVDWLAVSFFDQPREEMREFAILARKLNKPFMIAEASPWRHPFQDPQKAKDDWFKPFFSFVEEFDVKALSYINCDWDQIPLFETMGWGDSRLQTSPKLSEWWEQKISERRFLFSSKNLFSQLGFKN